MAEYFEHFCHDHPLILTPEEKINKGGQTKVSCYACHRPVLEPAYTCSIDCGKKIILHRKCAELPRLVEHRLLPGRLLTLTVHNYANDFGMMPMCHNCGRNFEGFAYHGFLREDFEFNISISCGCFNYLLDEQRLIQHPSHHHPLIFIRKPFSLFHCDGCGFRDWDLAYTCNTCEFWIHKSCVSLPTTFENISQHHHPLSLSYFLPHIYRRFRFNCDVCNGRIFPVYWVYSCDKCRFLAHVKCATRWKEDVARGSNSNAEHEDGSLIQLPVNDVSVDLIKPFVIRVKGQIILPEINGTISTATEPQFFNHSTHPHPLTLVSISNEAAAAAAKEDGDGDELKQKQINISDDEEDEEMIVCDGCITPIKKSCPPHMYYSCDKCKFFLHLSCYQLPSELEHDHQKGRHKLLLRAREVLSRTFCYLCFRATNGLFYRCKDCDFRMDVKCASVPSVIKHAAHQHHRLIQRCINIDEFPQCDACGSLISDLNPYIYSSENHRFSLHYSCAMLPATAGHGWDKHELALSYPPYTQHPDEIYCEICEQEIHPKRWMYYCGQCDHTFHPFCLSRSSGFYKNFKFGHKLVLEKCHRDDHPLTYDVVTIRRGCNLCLVDVYDKEGFECAQCCFACCMLCAGIDVIESLDC